MAIPCFVPQVDDPEENYRRLERLLYELYHVLRALLGPLPNSGQPAGHSGNQSHHGPNPPQGGAGGSGGSSPGGATAEVPRSRARRGRRHHSASGATTPAMPSPQPPNSGRGISRVSFEHPSPSASSNSTASWAKLGGELRLIADTFSAARQQNQPGSPLPVNCNGTKVTSLQLATATLRLLRYGWTESAA